MKIKIDENLPASIAEILNNLGHNADTIPQEGLSGVDDETVWETAQREQRFLITQDLDFSDIRQFMPGTHCGILLLRLSNAERKNLNFQIEQVFRIEPVENWKRCFVIVTEHKIRVRYPQEEVENEETKDNLNTNSSGNK